MKKYQLILILFLVFLYSIIFYFNHLFLVKKREVYLSDINKSIINIEEKIVINSEEIYPSTYNIWGLNRSKLLEERENKIKSRLEEDNKITNNKSFEENININHKTICIDKKCWKFLGVFTMNNTRNVTLLSLGKQEKLETFKKGDILLDSLVIRSIEENRMVVFHSKKEKVFILKLFDINISAYYPTKIQLDNKKEFND